MRIAPSRLLLAMLVAGLASCKFVKTTELEAEAEAARQPSAAASAGRSWDAEVLPYLEKKATPFGEVMTAARKNLDEAGSTYGYREAGEGSPWNFVVKVSGSITGANTQSRAASADVDVDGDGKADLTLQLGPIIRGTSIRDALPFVSFTQVRNQIEFANVAKAFNQAAYDTALKAVPHDDLVGRKIEALGVFTLRSSSEKVLMTPVTIHVGAQGS